MDNVQKLIMIGVGLFITIIVIAAVMLITGIGQDLLNSGTQQMTGITDSMDQGTIDQIESNVGSVLGRSQCMTLAKQVLNLGGTIKIEYKTSTTDAQLTGASSSSDVQSKFNENGLTSRSKFKISGSVSDAITFEEQ